MSISELIKLLNQKALTCAESKTKALETLLAIACPMLWKARGAYCLMFRSWFPWMLIKKLAPIPNPTSHIDFNVLESIPTARKFVTKASLDESWCTWPCQSSHGVSIVTLRQTWSKTQRRESIREKVPSRREWLPACNENGWAGSQNSCVEFWSA